MNDPFDTDPTTPSRRSVLIGASAALALPVLAASTALAATRTSQAVAAYRSSPNGDKACAACGNFEAPSGCELVEGPISSVGWCSLWSKRET
ncbi:MAG: iron oxidase [Siculibacillus sp.]